MPEAIAKARKGELLGYTHCSFSIKGTGRCKPGEKNSPQYGSKNSLSAEEEEKIECLKANKDLDH